MPPAARPPRADSVRNRARILDAARTHFAQTGGEVSMQQIASSAGVAVGTLYNHFPTKADLALAVVGSFIHEVAERAEELLADARLGSRSAGDAVHEFFRFVLDIWAANHAAKLSAIAFGPAPAERNADELRAAAALASLLEEAQRDGSIRAGVTVEDMYLLIESAPMSGSKASRERWLELVFDGVRSRD